MIQPEVATDLPLGDSLLQGKCNPTSNRSSPAPIPSIVNFADLPHRKARECARHPLQTFVYYHAISLPSHSFYELYLH